MIVALIFGLILGLNLVPSGLKFKAHSRKPQITCKLKMCFLPLVGIGLIFLLRSPLKLKLRFKSSRFPVRQGAVINLLGSFLQKWILI